MKSVVQIQRQGNVKNVSASAAASGLPIEEIDSTVALIQALIPLRRVGALKGEEWILPILTLTLLFAAIPSLDF